MTFAYQGLVLRSCAEAEPSVVAKARSSADAARMLKSKRYVGKQLLYFDRTVMRSHSASAPYNR